MSSVGPTRGLGVARCTAAGFANGLEVTIHAKEMGMKKSKTGFLAFLSRCGWVALLTAAVGCSPVI